LAEQLTEAHVLGAVLAPSEIEVPRPKASPIYGKVKAVVDVAVATVLLVLSTPVMAGIGLAIWLDSPGQILFRQQRIGLRGQPFTIYKFRTMVTDAPQYSYKVAMRDQRITRVGRWLRRSGLDELPQVINVIRREMSMIGPRPELPFIVEQLEPWQLARHEVRPGITGWWQIHHRNDVPLHLNLDYDIYYLRNISCRLDALIAWRTVQMIVSGALRPNLPDPLQIAP
jgi:lipopolysaccharide/colanic/teichoic acid biosynthesis glycosyltransferase